MRVISSIIPTPGIFPWPQHDGSFGRQVPAVIAFDRRGTAAAIARILARPEQLPDTGGGRRQEGFRRGIEVQITAEIDHQQSIQALRVEEPHDKGRRSEHGAIDTARGLQMEHRIVAPEVQQVAVQGVQRRVTRTFGVIELGALAGYNMALAQLALQEGTTLQRHNVNLRIE